jgi:GWxTD domain-containing protein
MNSILAQHLAMALLESVRQLAAVALIAALVGRGLRHAAPQVRYALDCGALALMLIAPAATFVVLQTRAPAMLLVSDTRLGPIPNAPESNGIPTLLGRAATSPLLPWVPAAWLLGVAVLSLRWTAGWLYLRHMMTTQSSAVTKEIAAIVRRIAWELGIRRPVRVLQADWARVPCVAGWLHPVVLLPGATILGLPVEQLEAILAHELAHVRRRDWLIIVLQRLAETLLFFHPAVWWISHRITAEREHCCDDLAASVCGDRITYARALLSLEETRSPLAPALAANSGNLADRIRRLLETEDHDQSGGTAWMTAAVAIVVIAAVLVTAHPLGAQQSDKWAPSEFAKVRREAYDRDSDRLAYLGPYAKWLLDDVATLIAPEEAARFKQLTSDAERRQFIEQFWLRRDPTPGTPENEFKDRHYQKLHLAATRWAVPGGRGFLEDRGYFYLTYGPPDEIEQHPRVREDWAYRNFHYPDGRIATLFLRFDANGDITPETNPFPKPSVR